MDVFIKAAEYTEIPVPKFWKQDPAVIKAELLIQKQSTRESAVLSPSLQSDFRRVLELAPRLLEELMKVLQMAVIPHNEQGHGWLSPALGVIELSKCIVQSTSEDTAPLIAGYALVTFDCLVACTLLKDCKFIDRDFPMILFCFRQAWQKLLFH
ncbi:hypothetical protein F2Q68_00012632 [Brassica cretica]|uniref:Uncharacterized protein n=1 Tax=Brassica cretica TaxID=69181 RepID=A0A8S9KT15_BRACR|nr:hypothetical protein F2Q68_00012632 [Brassica cretica]